MTRIGYCHALDRLGRGLPVDERDIAIRETLCRDVVGERSQRIARGGQRRRRKGAGVS